MNKSSRRIHVDWWAKPKQEPSYVLRQGPLPESSYYLMSKPVLWMGIIFGRIPYTMKSGWMRHDFKSFRFVYSTILLLLNLSILVYYNSVLTNMFFRLLDDNVNFSGVLLTFLIVQQPFSCTVQIYSWIYEFPAIVRCYNTTAILEKKMFNQVPQCETKLLVRRVVALCLVSMFVGLLGLAYYLLSKRFVQLPHLIVLSMLMNIIVNYSYTVLWCYNFIYIGHLATALNKQIISCLEIGERLSFRLKILRNIWTCIWEQSQRYSSSIGVTVGFTLLINAFIFIIGCYGCCVTIRKAEFLNMLEIIPYVGVTFVNIAFVFESSYRATKKLGPTILHHLIIHDKHGRDHEWSTEVGKFINTINLARNASITLKDYMTIDRTLLVSFLSYSLTYLIVLLQFQGKSDSGCSSVPFSNITNQKSNVKLKS